MPRKDLFDQPPADDPRLPGSIGRVSEQQRIEAARKWFNENLTALQNRMKAPPKSEDPPLRLDLFLPYLLVRSAPGDRGGRPGNWPVSQSPDIWVAAGEPADAKPVPEQPLSQCRIDRPHTVYAHVWNLGRAPIVGARVEFYFTAPYPPNGPPGTVPAGVATVDLPPRSSPGCHVLVKCPQVFRPVPGRVREPGLGLPLVFPPRWELTVCVSAIGDPIGQNRWNPPSNRHVARRVVSVVLGDV